MDELEKFLNDPAFTQWIKEPDRELDIRWAEWKRNNPDKLNEFNEAVALLKSLRFKQYPVSAELVKNDWTKIKAGTQRKIRHRYSRIFYRVAAVLVLLVTASVSVYLLNKNSQTAEQHPVSYLQKEALPGQKLSIQLSDGTFIKLNAGSRLIYPSEFTADVRKVELIGEGYFQVAKNPAQPFVVECGNFVTEVLGTRFNVNGYDESKVEVALVEGSVEVSAVVDGRKEKKQINPGQKAFWENDRLAIEKLDTLKAIGWKDNILFFHKNSIQEVKSILERWYGVTIVVEDAAGIPDSFNGSFRNESLSNVLKSVGFALNFEYVIENKNVYIKPV